jgi:hypothetical protein
MKRSSYFVLALGVFLVGLFTVRCTEPTIPIVRFLSPMAGVPIVAEVDPLDAPVVVDVEVAFPPAVNPCAGLTFPVLPGTLAVTLRQMDDLTVVNEWAIDASGWWNETNDAIAGQITIGGESSGQSWSAYSVCVNIANAMGPVPYKVCQTVRVEKPIATYTGGTYEVRITGISQSPDGCILPKVLLAPVNQIIATLDFDVTTFDAADYPTSIALPLPDPIGMMYVDAQLDVPNNDLAFDPVTHAIDFGQINLPIEVPGVNCLVEGTATGAIDGQVLPDDLDGKIAVSQIAVSQGSGQGSCTISTPSDPACKLYIAIDGDPVGP